MFNTDYPDRADLPSSAKLVRSTIIAGVSAVAILVTTVLPSEYGIDPTGIGGLLQLTPMGEIKVQLAQEAAAQASAPAAPPIAVATAAPSTTAAQAATIVALERRVVALEQLVAPVANIPAAPAAVAVVEPLVPATPVADVSTAAPGWRDEISFTLTPGQGSEYKLVMAAGAIASYEFAVDGGVINFDQHGEGQGQSFRYGEGRSVQGDSGSMQAAGDGTHGWFFRNRGNVDVVVTLRTGGDYVELRKLS